jgi:hypothetical protein
MAARRALIEEEIARREASRAYLPTEELHAQLALLRLSHAAVLALLGGWPA